MASTDLDLAAAQPWMKELYDGQAPVDETYKDHPFFTMLRKMEDFQGKSMPLPLKIGNGGGRSATFANAQGNKAAPRLNEFQLLRATDYAVGGITTETVEASRSSEGAFKSMLEELGDSTFENASRSISSALFRSGTGSIGQISSITSGVITLADPASVVQFEVDQVLQANATDGGTPRAAVAWVVQRDAAAGTITVGATQAGSAASPSGWTANDFLLIQGDVNAKIKGLSAWLPTTAPTTGDSFFGVDRSVDSSRLAGVRSDGRGKPLDEALIDALALLCREGGRPDNCILGPVAYAGLVKTLGAKVEYVDVSLDIDGVVVGFRGIKLASPDGVVNVFSDRDCPAKLGYLLEMKTWALYSARKAPHVLDLDGLQIRANPTADTWEMRVGMFGNLGCNAPGHNCVVQLDM